MPSTVRIEIDSSVRHIARVQAAVGELLSEHGVSDILHITQLITVFSVFDDEAEAVDSFS